MPTINPDFMGLIEKTIIFLFTTAIPALWTGHLAVAEKLAGWYGHPEIQLGLGLTMWIISTTSWFLLAERFLHTFNSIIKFGLFVVVLYIISAMFLGVGSL